MEKQANILDFLPFKNPTKEQEVALIGMADFVSNESQKDFLILSGAAGTGKSSITTALVSFLNTADINYHICAPTGRAARIIGRKSASWATTIHSLIYKPETNIETGVVTYNLKRNEDTEKMVFIIDEASMIGTSNSMGENDLFRCKNGLLQDLILYIKMGNKNSKIVFLGDRNQLTPINEKVSQALEMSYLKNQLIKNSKMDSTEKHRYWANSFGFFAFCLLLGIGIRSCNELDLEKEKTEQLKVQQKINYKK